MSASRAFNPATMLWILASGVIATVAFDYFGQSLSPQLGYARLAPIPLATQVINVMTGIKSVPLATALHWITGIVFYAFGYVLIAYPIAKMIMPRLPAAIIGLVYGAGLWVFALYIMAHLVAGNPPFLGFTGITWVALVGHMLFGLIVAVILMFRGYR